MSSQSYVIDFEGVREIIRNNPVTNSIEARIEEGKRLTKSDREYLNNRYFGTLDKENVFLLLSSSAAKLSNEDLEAYFYGSLVRIYNLTVDSVDLYEAIVDGFMLPSDGVNYFKGISSIQFGLDEPNKILGKMFVQTDQGLINDGHLYILKYASGTEAEIKRWRLLLEWKVPTPYIFLDLKAFGIRCMAVEQLQPLSPLDFSSKLAIDITNALERLAPHAVHSMISPSTIGRRADESTYFLTGWDSMSMKPKGFGFERMNSNPFWTSQPDSGAISTVRNDLLELGFVLGFLGRWTDQYTYDGLAAEAHDVYRFPKGIQVWIDRVRVIDERNVYSTDFDDLRKIAASLA